MIYEVKPTTKFTKDLKKVKKRGHLRECHITPDWLLVYEKSEETLILYLTRTGSHSDLF